MVDRTDLAAVIRDEYSNTFLTRTSEASGALQAFKRLDMNSKQTSVPFLDGDPTAYWVDENEEVPTSDIAYKDLRVIAEEVGVTVPVSIASLEDATEDVIADIVARGSEAIAKKLDNAVFAGINKPSTWITNDLLTAADVAGQEYVAGEGVDDLIGNIYKAAGAITRAKHGAPKVIAAPDVTYLLANQRDKNGAFLNAGAVLDGFSSVFTSHLPDDVTAFVVGDDAVRIAVRKDIEVNVFDQASLPGGVNLASQRKLGVMFTARYGYALRADNGSAVVRPVIAGS